MGAILLEIGLRLFNPQPSFQWFTYDQNIHRWNRGQNDRYFQLDPSFSGQLTFNERGERDHKTPAIKSQPGIFRILMLGTSLTLGWPEDYGVTEMLEEKMKNSKRPVEVINCSLGNSNLSTMLQTLKSRCLQYENVDAVVLALPLNALVDFVGANSALWGENYIDDPNQLFYFLKFFDLADVKFKRSDAGTPMLDLTDGQKSQLLAYFNDGHWLYDHSQIDRWLVNRFKYRFIADNHFLKQGRALFSKTFSDIPSPNRTLELIQLFVKMQKDRWNLDSDHLIVALLPTYQGFLLKNETRASVMSRLKEVPFYRFSMESPESFVGQSFHGDLNTYLNRLNLAFTGFKLQTTKQGVTWLDLRENFNLGKLESYYIGDLYHYSLAGHEAFATELALRITPLEK
jgi:hypothetical protein